MSKATQAKRRLERCQIYIIMPIKREFEVKISVFTEKILAHKLCIHSDLID